MNGDQAVAQNRKWKILGSGLLAAIVVVALGLAYHFLAPRPTEDEKPRIQKLAVGPCPGETVDLVMQDTLMDGWIRKDQKIRVITNWYACNPIEKGDLVYYQYSSNFDPVVKVVRAAPGDFFKVARDKKFGAWNLIVNGDLLMDEASQAPYYFGAEPNTVLSLYEKANGGVLKDGDVILLSNVPPGGNDSGLYGVANVTDIIGKVEIVSP
jgi:hypothetical protein